jgi:hypothetical protein
MAGTVEFDVTRLIGQLNALQATQINYAGGRAMRRLGVMLKVQLSQHMQQTFRDPVPFTLSSPRARSTGLELSLSISTDGARGQDPARYLYPVSTEGTSGAKPAYTTRFTKALRRRGIVDDSYYAVPWLEGRGVPTNSYGNVPPSFYQQTLAGLARFGAPGGRRTSSAGWQYLSVPDRRQGPAIRRTSSLERRPGIYRVKGRDLQFLFGYARRPPIIRTSLLNIPQFASSRAQLLLPNLLREELERTLS